MKTRSVILVVILLMTTALYSQNITNTLGTTGVFIIKSSADTLLKLQQSDGFLGLGIKPTQQLELTKNLKLPVTGGLNTGVIYKGNDRFIHNYKPASVPGRNLFVGTNSGNFTMHYDEDFSASYNVGLGDSTLADLTVGFGNTAIGTYSLTENMYGNLNTGVGFNSLRKNQGIGNTSIGVNSMYLNNLGQYNIAMGYSALYSNNSGIKNCALGYQSMFYNISGNNNVALGNSALFNNFDASFNTAIGTFALYSNSTGINNTAFGYYAGYNVQTGSNNTLIGNNAQPTTSSVSNQITLGNNQITSLRCNVQSITSLSDIRDKKNIEELSLGLEFISKLQPRQFSWDKREWYDNNVSDGSKAEEKLNAGFIAQELDEVQAGENAEWLGLVNKENPDKIEATYGNLLPVMVKAIQELNSKNESVLAQNELLKKENEELKNILQTLSVKVESLINGNPEIRKTNYVK